MFEGSNSVRLNRAALCAAVEEYFNRRVAADRDKLKFTSVAFESGGVGNFMFLTEPKEVPHGAQAR